MSRELCTVHYLKIDTEVAGYMLIYTPSACIV
jgi:hypothetical protein